MKKKYTKKDLIVRFSEKMGFSKKTSKLLVENFLNTFMEILTEKKPRVSLELRNFGIFDVKETKPKPKARNPRTNELIYVGKRRKISFRSSKRIKNILLKQVEK